MPMIILTQERGDPVLINSDWIVHATGGKSWNGLAGKTSIAGVQISNWMIVLGAVIIMLLIYTSMQEVQIPH